MKTQLLSISEPALVSAVEFLAAGLPVAFPTETVYGLAVRADDDDAVRRVFEAKGRPPDKRLIVHVLDVADARRFTDDWPAGAERLALAYWPGPLTLVVKYGIGLANAVTADGQTVAVRAPSHPVARRLLQACPFPLVAPSANLSGHAAPSTAAEVLKSLDGRIPLVLDAGPATYAQPSTIVEVLGNEARVLRQGEIGRERIAEHVKLQD